KARPRGRPTWPQPPTMANGPVLNRVVCSLLGWETGWVFTSWCCGISGSYSVRGTQITQAWTNCTRAEPDVVKSVRIDRPPETARISCQRECQCGPKTLPSLSPRLRSIRYNGWVE